MKSTRDQSHDIKGALFKALYLTNCISDRVEIFLVSTKGCDIENGLYVQITLSHDLSSDTEGVHIKVLYLLNYMSDRVETLHLSSKGIVMDEN